MSTTIFTAGDYDPARERRRRKRIFSVILVVLLIASALYAFRNWPEERVVKHFFTALENKDYEKAYGIWVADRNWKQHPQQHPKYSFGEFYLDWGPGGEYGLITSFKIDGSANPKGGSGVIVQVTVNDRKEPARLWVEKGDKSLTFSPF
jgi:hypothetical protein